MPAMQIDRDRELSWVRLDGNMRRFPRCPPERERHPLSFCLANSKYRRSALAIPGHSAIACDPCGQKNDPIPLRIKKAGRGAVTSGSRPAMHEHHRLAVYRAVFLPVDPVLRIPITGKVA